MSETEETPKIFRRNIELALSEEWIESVGGLPNKSVENAIGYLSHWGIGGGRFVKVLIWSEQEGSLSARYYAAESSGAGYEIFGLWDKKAKTYSFHS